MLDKAKYWLELCDDDMKAAEVLFDNGQFLWMSFVCHLIVEKAIKAVIVSKTTGMPPKIHKLDKLAEFGCIYDELTDAQKDLLDKLTPLQIEGRYPEYKERISALLSQQYCYKLFTETREFVCWIKKKLER